MAEMMDFESVASLAGELVVLKVAWSAIEMVCEMAVGKVDDSVEWKVFSRAV